MGYVAVVGSSISGTTASNYCCTSRDRDCVSWNRDEDGNRTSCARWGPWYCTSTSSASISGSITTGSNFVYINGTSVATKGSQTSESASSCRYPDLSNGSGSGTGTVSQGSNFVYVGGNPIAERGHNVNTHSGSGSITSANSFVYVA